MSSAVLRARELDKFYGDRKILDGVSLTASPGQRLGLVGENGIGKSTLLRLLAGVEEPSGGEVRRPTDTGFLTQELPFAGAATVGTVVDDALCEIRAAIARLTELAEALRVDPLCVEQGNATLLDEYGDVLDWAQAHDAWDADRRAELVLDGLGLRVAASRRLDTLSGGQRSRLAIAALLIRQPAALLLDEPTNHLDDAAIAFLERHIRSLPGVVVVASHDRVFLDEVCTDIVDLDPTRNDPTRNDPTRNDPTRYGGAYSEYLHAKRAERVRWEQQYAAEQETLKQLHHAVAVTARQVNHNRASTDNDKMGYGFHSGRVLRQVSRRVRNARQRLDELTRDQVRKPPEPLRFSARLGSEVDGDGLAISMRDIEVPGRLRLARLDVTPTDRLLVTGVNGAGKSTLLSVLDGRLEPSIGTVGKRRGLRVGLLEQDVSFMDGSASAQRIYRARVPAGPPLAELGLLGGADSWRPVETLSVGQRRRLALALLIAAQPQVLLLDEPTNHLSLALADELEEALRAAAGAVVIATHDRWLRRRWHGRELAMIPYEHSC
ncbi:MAG: ABC-F family ATP-binding cassette domain-containing protein [Sciscionella sp.]